MTNLRWLERDGKMILQYEITVSGQTAPYHKWHDVPVHKKPEQQKPREFWIDPHAEYYHRTKVGGHYIHVTEIPKGYKLINIDKLLQTLCYSGITGRAADNFINEVGFSND